MDMIVGGCRAVSALAVAALTRAAAVLGPAPAVGGPVRVSRRRRALLVVWAVLWRLLLVTGFLAVSVVYLVSSGPIR